MDRDQMADLTAFMVVAEELSFTKAAARLGMSQSAISQIVRRLEDRMGLRLLSRTTRSVAPTEAGDRLFRTLSPMLQELDASLVALSELRDTPSGSLRITATEHSAKMYVLPALRNILPDHPDISVEIVMDYGLIDVVEGRFDAGVRLGEAIEKDMIAVRISPEIEMSVVGAPSYFSIYAPPETPKDLIDHRCINLRLPSSGTINVWRFLRRGREARVQVEGPLTFNTIDLILDAALDGLGLAYLPSDQVEQFVSDGRLVKVLDAWAQPLPPYHLFYPNRRFASPAFRLLVDALRHR